VEYLDFLEENLRSFLSQLRSIDIKQSKENRDNYWPKEETKNTESL
jgi:hypothetical protein